MIDQPAERVSHAIKYAESLKAKMELMMKVGDDIEHPNQRKNNPGKLNADAKAEVEKQCEEAVQRINAGEGICAIANDYGITYQALTDRLKRRGTDPRQKRNQNRFDK